MNRRTILKSLIAASASGALGSHGAAAQTPAASPADPSAIALVDVPGVVLGLSPDGTMAAGTGDREVLAVWAIATLKTVAQSDPLPELRILDQASLTWSPDNTALAWSLDAARQMRDSDVYVFDMATATITNITDDDPAGEDATSLLQSIATPGLLLGIDMFPSWLPDASGLVFARTPWGDDAPRETRLMQLSREGGEATEIALLSGEEAFLVSGPMFPLDDGSVLYATWPPNLDSPDHGVFLVTPDGAVEGVSTGILVGDTPALVLLDVAPQVRKATAVSLRNYATFTRDMPIWVELDLDTGIPTAFEEVLSLPARGDDDERSLVASPAFLADTNGDLTGYLYATTDARHDTFTLWRHDLATGEATTLGSIANPGARGPGITRLPRVQVTASGTAGLFFAGDLWTIAIG